ncbi:unnamed protein product, partial [Rotaria sp. Silwood1]
MGTIFRVISVKEYDSTYLIGLQVETQVQECLSKLTAHLRTDNMHSIASELTLALKIQLSSIERTKDHHLLVAQSMNNRAALQFEKEDFPTAESSFQRALDTKLAIEGLDTNSHASLANAYNNLAMVQLKQGRFEEELANFERTLKIELSI